MSWVMENELVMENIMEKSWKPRGHGKVMEKSWSWKMSWKSHGNQEVMVKSWKRVGHGKCHRKVMETKRS